MSDIVELERRITAALDRIDKGAEALVTAPEQEDAGEIETLKAALEDEKLVTAQLEERIKALHEKQDRKLAEAEKQASEARALMEKLDGELQRLRAANDQLRASNQALREANEAGVGEPHLINKAMLAELEGVRAARAADQAEVGAILGAMEPLLNGADKSGEAV
ncbi:MAG: hypothetical protein CSA70_04245 [Rhodobacterales bacterium]|nr:MAG: hypothetical protein CSA70_04245 [Rhodobacterales bacterium]